MQDFDDKTYLSDVLESIEKIEDCLRNVDFELYSKCHMMVDTVVRNFEIIREAKSNVSDEYKKSHSWVP